LPALAIWAGGIGFAAVARSMLAYALEAIDEDAAAASVPSRPLSRPEPDGGIVEHGAATRQAGIGAGQEVDPDPFLEGVVRP
jgi:hypothetical protein